MKKINSIFLLVLFASLFSGCVKEEAYNKKVDSPADGVVFLQQAVSFPQELTIFPFVDAARTFTFNAGFGAVGYSSKAPHLPIRSTLDGLDVCHRALQMD